MFTYLELNLCKVKPLLIHCNEWKYTRYLLHFICCCSRPIQAAIFSKPSTLLMRTGKLQGEVVVSSFWRLIFLQI